MEWSTIQAALQTWIATASGLGTGKVVWAGQSRNLRVEKPFIAIRVSTIQRPGLDWVQVDASDPDTILYMIRGVRTLSLSLTAYADSAVGSGAAVAILDSVLTGLYSPIIHAALSAAKVGPTPVGPIRSIDGLVNFSEFEPRATVEVLVHCASTVTTAGNYIESVEIEDEDRGTSIVVDLDP